MVFENGVLKRIFGPKRDEVTGDWRKLHSEELRDLYFVIFGFSNKGRWAGCGLQNACGRIEMQPHFCCKNL
jgi:hypothetical protein